MRAIINSIASPSIMSSSRTFDSIFCSNPRLAPELSGSAYNCAHATPEYCHHSAPVHQSRRSSNYLANLSK